MALRFRSIRLPFVRVTQSRRGKRAFTWHLGPWSYSSATGAHSVKLTKKVRYVTKSRAQKAAAAKVAAKRRAAERAAWDEQIAATNGRPSTVPTPQVQVHRSTTIRRPGETEEQFLRRGRSEAMAGAGLCRARTRDGSPCLNAGNCPHHPRGGRA